MVVYGSYIELVRLGYKPPNITNVWGPSCPKLRQVDAQLADLQRQHLRCGGHWWTLDSSVAGRQIIQNWPCRYGLTKSDIYIYIYIYKTLVILLYIYSSNSYLYVLISLHITN